MLVQVLPHPQLIFPSKIWFFGIYLNFQWQESLLNQYPSHSGSKSYQINSIKSYSSSSLNTKGTLQFLRNFQIQFNLIFNKEIIQYSKTFAPQVQTPWNQAHAPLLVKSFPKTPRTRSEASQFGGSHNYKTNQNKTNYLPSEIDCELEFNIVWKLSYTQISGFGSNKLSILIHYLYNKPQYLWIFGAIVSHIISLNVKAQSKATMNRWYMWVGAFQAKLWKENLFNGLQFCIPEDLILVLKYTGLDL